MNASSDNHVLFLYICEQSEINFGIGCLSAYLKSCGWKTTVLPWKCKNPSNDSLNEILDSIRRSVPSFLCLSAMTLHYPSILKLLDRLREVFKGPVIVGGHHAIERPQDFHAHPAVDAVCIGDGEQPLQDFIEACKTGRDAYGIPGIWGKGRFFSSEWKGNYWYVPNLMDYPFLDYAIFNEFEPLPERVNMYFCPSRQSITVLSTISGRGCPFRCSYCTNDSRMSKFPSMDAYLRKYSPQFLVDQLAIEVERYQVKFIEFIDELFIYDKRWTLEFAEIYRKTIRLPFSTQIRLEFVNDEICRALTNSGWILAGFGIECGNEEYRLKYLGRKMSNENIEKKVSILKKYGIRTITTNILGMPFETSQTYKDTLNLNRKIQPDVAMHFHWQPMPGTKLTQIAIDSGWFPDSNFVVSNYGTIPGPPDFHAEVERHYAEFSAEKFSIFSGGPDRLMDILTEHTHNWIAKNPPQR